MVERGSFTAAAVRRGVTQPAVSLLIRQLERQLGLRLLERVGRRVRPTPAGQDLLPHALRVREAMEAAVATVAPHRAGQVGRVRLGTGGTACIHWLPPILRGLRERLPGLEIAVRTGNTPDMLRLLEENALDLALVTLPAPGRAFAVTPLCDDPLLAAFPPGEAPPPGGIDAAALGALPLVLYETGGQTRRLIDDWFLRSGIATRPVMALGSVEAIKELVGAGLGCAVLPGMALRTGTQAGGPPLATRPLAPPLHRSLGLVMRRDKRLDRGLREVVAALAAAGRAAGGTDIPPE
ncbi:LysR family transcriptional regulator [Roseomonas sp. OT10]|nr:LysR family transcriptional regulator [Roseomonas sp. OT10]